MRNTYRVGYDERTRAFLTDRWHTPLGEEVRHRIFQGIVNSVDLRFTLEQYTLDAKVYGTCFPAEYYPHEHMSEDTFWVLHGYDLRGFFFNEVKDYRGTPSLSKMRLDYAVFPMGTNLSGVNLEMTSLEGTTFYECKLVGTCFAGASGTYTSFEKSDMRDVLLWQARFHAPNLQGCDVRGAYLEDCYLEDAVLDFRTRFDESIVREWENRRIDDLEAARIYRQLADTHRAHRFFGKADAYYVAERRTARKQLQIELREGRSLTQRIRSTLGLVGDYLSDALFGYGVRPGRIAGWSGVAVLLFGLAIWLFDLVSPSPSLGSALYTSILTFTTFGLGEPLRPDGAAGRAVIGAEAVVGVFLTTLFLITIARKIIRD
ncbi:MAG: pentapeptide repeat-containing protein [Dehalococcoidia bacterium]